MEVHFLDVGPKKYGDCILCRLDGQLILIDGAHPPDWKARDDGKRKSIPDQIAAITKKAAPFKLDLLVVTHAHLDHTGCLPKLVEDGTITAKWALMADEKLGWGRHRPQDAKRDAALPDSVRRLAAALREDMVPDLSDAAGLRDFMDVAQKQEDAYKEMLEKLKAGGTKIVRFGRNSTTALVNAFKKWNLKILGPAKSHLVKCADALSSGVSDAIAMADRMKTDAGTPASAEDIYISLMRNLPSDAADSGSSRLGSALNDMSIVLTLGPAGRKVLLAGDMQYVKPEVDGLEEDMRRLRKKTADAGPYLIAKTCHHTSSNAAGAELFSEWGADVFLVHSGGEYDDPAHPAPSVLETLSQRAEQKPGLWARNDRNRLVSCFIKSDGDFKVTIGSGDVDDFTRNQKAPDQERPHAVSGGVEAKQPMVRTVSTGDHVEVTVKIPHVTTRVTVTVDVSPGQSVTGPLVSSGGGPGEIPLAELPATLGRALSAPLLVATCRPRLEANVGPAAAARAIEMLREAGATVLDSLPDPSAGIVPARTAVHTALRGRDYSGVVLLGGPDVVPSAVLDTLDPPLREAVRKLNLPANYRDPDDFIVWSDHPYGDISDGDGDLPVSRVPDGHSATLLLRALAAVPGGGENLFGLRNRHRPFASHVFQKSMRSAADCLASSPVSPVQVLPAAAAAARVYLMLHGSDEDATIFNGEDENEEHVPAFDLSCIPPSLPGSVVFSGCCWGALIAGHTARHAQPGLVPARRAEESIPLAFLQRGAAAFIGCTGVHYSPEDEVPDCFGGPMHTAFWEATHEGLPPALALFQARERYLAELPHGRDELLDYAVEYKIYHQFTCLGLGW